MPTPSLTDTILEALPVAVYALRDGRFVYLSERFAQSLGYTKEELLALDCVTQVIAEPQRDQINEMLRRRAKGSSEESRFFTTVRCRDGKLLDAEVHGSVTEFEGERIVIGTAVDMTAHVASTRKVIEREEYFRALTENIADVIAILDSAGRVTYVNPSVTRILGGHWTNLLNKPFFERVHAEDRESFSRAVLELKHKRSFGPAEYRVRHADGSWRVMEVVGSNLLHHPHIHGFVLNMRDVTERKRMEREVAQLNRLTSLGRLATQVAHEFNNVLMGIQSMMNVIRRRAAENDDVLGAADTINAALSRGKRVTTDILRFGRPAQLAIRAVDANALVRQSIGELRSTLPERIDVHLALLEIPRAAADPGQLAQVLTNLIFNARDAMTQGGTLTIETNVVIDKASDRFIRLKITDTGEGMAPDDLPYIFEPFFTTKKTGTGIGLAVVYQIVRAHGGHISVQSELGKGTTFEILIPVLNEHVSEEPSETELAHRARRRVLIVDDDEITALGLRLSLEADGVAVAVVHDGADAAAAVAEFDPDAVILDLSLADADGRDVYAQLNRQHPVLPVIFSSGHATESEINEILQNPRTAFLMKPYSTAELLQTIENLLTV